MKSASLSFLFLLVSITASAQYDYGFEQYFFFGRHPSARAEALGKAYAAIDGDLYSVFYNPAGISTIKKFEVNYSNAHPLYLAEKAKYYYANAGYKISDYFVFALSFNQFSWGDNISSVDAHGNIIGYDAIYTNNYTVSIASQPFKDFHAGLNINYYDNHEFPGTQVSNPLYFDLGILKLFRLSQKETSANKLNFGASLGNLNAAELAITYNGQKSVGELPSILRLGAAYFFTYNKHGNLDSLNTVDIIIQVGYDDPVNSKYLTAIRVGMEIKLFEIVSLRMGYYTESLHDYGFPDFNYSELNDFTYGLGLALPLVKVTPERLPLTIAVDYTTLPQPLYAIQHPFGEEFSNFHTLNLRLSWHGRRK
jgi:hypothetical protein